MLYEVLAKVSSLDPMMGRLGCENASGDGACQAHAHAPRQGSGEDKGAGGRLTLRFENACKRGYGSWYVAVSLTGRQRRAKAREGEGGRTGNGRRVGMRRRRGEARVVESSSRGRETDEWTLKP